MSTASPKQSRRLPLFGGLIAVTLGQLTWLALFASERINIGVQVEEDRPPEWIWNPHVIPSVIDVLLPISGCLAGVMLYLFCVNKFSGRPGNSKNTVGTLVFLSLCGFGILWMLQACAPSPHRQVKPMWILYHWGSSGYFKEAADIGQPNRQDSADSLSEYLQNYQAEMAGGDVLHKGTHPPGLVMANYALLEWCRGSPALTKAVLGTLPVRIRQAFQQQLQGGPIAEEDLAALWLSVLVTHLLAALTVVPLFFLARRAVGSGRAVLLAGLWPLTPGLAVFLPKSDAFYPVLAAGFLWLALSAWQQTSPLRAIAAGLVFWCGMMLSLAILPVAVVAAIWCLLRWRTDGPKLSHAVGTVATILVTFALATVAFSAWAGTNMLVVWLQNYRNHAGFYAQYPRTYWRWLLANPAELVLTTGAPILFCACVAFTQAVRKHDSKFLSGPCAVFGAWSILWLSGKNMGEAARLWLFLTPLFLWSGSRALESDEDRHRFWWTVAICQAVVAITTAALVNGFGS